MKYLISFALATYNGSKYLKEQLDSFYNQTYKNFEVIVVDDVSTDDTVKILEQYKRKYGLIYFVNSTNLGVTKNFEKAISMCSGEYIALADQDDIWLPKKLEILHKNIGDSSLIYSNACIINENSEIQNETTKDIHLLYGLDSNTKDLYNYLVLNSFILGCSVMFKQELVKDLIPIFQTSRNHDWWLTICAYKKNGIKYIDEVLFNYRHHDNNYSRQGDNTTFIQKVISFYSKNRIFNRKERIIEQCAIIEHLFSYDKNISENEKRFLNNLKDFCESFLKTKIHIKAFYLSFKYEKYMFMSENIFENKLHLLSRLIG